MPVHREKVDKVKTEVPNADARSTNFHRTKQREVSLERRPIISQEKPSEAKKKAAAEKKIPKINASSKANVATRNLQIASRGRQKESNVLIKPLNRQPTETQAQRKNERTKSTNKNTGEVASRSKISGGAGNLPSKTMLKVSKEKDTKLHNKPSRNHERTRTRTLSPSEIKINLATETDIPNTRENQLTSEENDKETESSEGEGEEDEYEEDFEDYESDFEEDSSQTDSEKKYNEREPSSSILSSAMRRRVKLPSSDEGQREVKLDSGSYHISGEPHKREIEEIKTAMQNENLEKRKPSIIQTPDEGFLDKLSFPPSGNEELKRPIINFEKAQLQQKNSKALKRGEMIMKMITLDSIFYALLEIPAISYDTFMSTYGKSNTSQVHTQTKEDNCEVDTQTEEIETSTKWTQAPTVFKPKITNGVKSYTFTKQERLGVGDDQQVIDQTEEIPFVHTNSEEFKKFVTTQSQKILSWLAVRHQPTKSNLVASYLPCCDEMKTIIPEGTCSPVILTQASNGFLLTVQNTAKTSTIKIWSVTDTERALFTLVCREDVTCACFEPVQRKIVLAGASDGSVNLWDLTESTNIHRQLSEENRIKRTPTYSTANQGHKSALVSLVLVRKNDENYEGTENYSATQVASLSTDGEVIIWTIVELSKSRPKIVNEDFGLAPWGKIRLVNSHNLKLSELISRTENPVSNTPTFTMMTSYGKQGELIIAEFSGSVILCSADSSRATKIFTCGSNRQACVTTIALCPIDRRFFLAGCSEGTIRLHSKDQPSPLNTLHWNLAERSSSSGIKSLLWLPNRPCTFVALDVVSRIHVWNLAESDIYPQFSLPPPMNASISSCVLSQKTSRDIFIVLGKADGTTELHKIERREDKEMKKNQWEKEAKMFQRYVKIL